MIFWWKRLFSTWIQVYLQKSEKKSILEKFWKFCWRCYFFRENALILLKGFFSKVRGRKIRWWSPAVSFIKVLNVGANICFHLKKCIDSLSLENKIICKMSWKLLNVLQMQMHLLRDLLVKQNFIWFSNFDHFLLFIFLFSNEHIFAKQNVTSLVS